MPTRKIGELPWPQGPCLDADHDPPKHQQFWPGEYEHTCRQCGRVVRFTVNRKFEMKVTATR
jgi:hypothetical protein